MESIDLVKFVVLNMQFHLIKIGFYLYKIPVEYITIFY